MPTEIKVKVVNLEMGDKFILTKVINRELPQKGRWIAYKPKFKKKRK